MNAAYTSRGRRDEVAASSRIEVEEVVVRCARRRNNMALWLLFSVPPLLGRNRTVRCFFDDNYLTSHRYHVKDCSFGGSRTPKMTVVLYV